MLKFEDLTSERAKKATSRGKARSRQSDNERATSEPSSESESELKKQLRQRKKKQKIQINSSKAEAEERKECQEGSSSKPEQKYNYRIGLHADDGIELTDKEPIKNQRMNILTLARKSLFKDLTKIEKQEKINKDLAGIANKVWQHPDPFENFKTKKKTYKKNPRTVLTYSLEKCNKEIQEDRMNVQESNKDLRVQKVQVAVVKGAFAICEVPNDLINFRNNINISGKQSRLQLSNVIGTESPTFLGTANTEGHNIRRQYLSKILPPKLTKDAPIPLNFFLGNNSNDRIRFNCVINCLNKIHQSRFSRNFGDFRNQVFFIT